MPKTPQTEPQHPLDAQKLRAISKIEARCQAANEYAETFGPGGKAWRYHEPYHTPNSIQHPQITRLQREMEDSRQRRERTLEDIAAGTAITPEALDELTHNCLGRNARWGNAGVLDGHRGTLMFRADFAAQLYQEAQRRWLEPDFGKPINV
jgi:hypothetical protein